MKWLIAAASLVCLATFAGAAPSSDLAKSRLDNKFERLVTYVNGGFKSVAISLEGILGSMATKVDFKGLQETLSKLDSLKPKCHGKYVEFDGMCYQLTACSGSCHADTVRKICHDGGANLAKIRSKPHYDFILSHLPKKYIIIGGNDRAKEGTWVWPDGSGVDAKTGWTNWANNNPAKNNAIDCMFIHINKQMYSRACTKTLASGAYVCEKKMAYTRLSN